MTFIDKLNSGVATISCELFPPKNPAGWSTLYSTLGAIARLTPDFVSVTYGAGGSTREKTIDIVRRIRKELEIEAVAHLTCVGHSQAELSRILTTLKENQVTSVMALRGDPPIGEANFTPHPDGFSHACELIEIANTLTGFHIGCAFYPEKHPEASTIEQDIDYLKLKQDAGATFGISQAFFENDAFYRFRDIARAGGVTIPLIAGILPVKSSEQLAKIIKMSGASVPAELANVFGDDSISDAEERGLDFAVAQSIDLLKNGVNGIHLYTFNKSDSSVKIVRILREQGWIAPPKRTKQPLAS